VYRASGVSYEAAPAKQRTDEASGAAAIIDQFPPRERGRFLEAVSRMAEVYRAGGPRQRKVEGDLLQAVLARKAEPEARPRLYLVQP
jgi:hypothetical protein